MPYIFLDESGQFGKYDNEKYFIVGSFTVGNPRRTERQFYSWHKLKFPKKLLIARLLPQLPKNSIIQIEMVSSAQNANIQIADWIAGALAWSLEDKPLGEDCCAILKNNILRDGKELFKNYLENKFSKQKSQSSD